MANQLLQYPSNPHFFRPLLPGFHTHLNIPVAFFSQHVRGINDRNKSVKLRSDASDRTWLVKLDGLKFTDGWDAFASAHDLRVGDIIVFRHEGDMVFHVTPLGPSCSEIEYASSLNMDDTSDDQDQTNIVSVKKSLTKKLKSSIDHSRFVTKVSTWSLKSDHMYIPLTFARSYGLHKMCGKKIFLLNEEGKSWKLSLKTNKRDMHTYARLGWKRFCDANEMSQGHYTFKLVQKSEPLVIQLCRTEYRPKQRSEFSSDHSCFEGSVIRTGLYKDKLYLPRNFVSSNGLDKGCSEIVLKNKQGRRWTLALKHYKSTNLTFLRKGWNNFCQANRIKLGDSFKFKLVGTGKKPVLSLCSVVTNRDNVPSGSLFSNPISRGECSKSRESEEEDIKDKTISQKCLKIKKRKYMSRCRYSAEYMDYQTNTVTGNSSREKRMKKNPRNKVESSSNLSSFVANVSASSLRHNQLPLPMSFARSNGLDSMSGEKIVLLNEEGRSWKLELRYNKTAMQTYAISGWKNFCTANRLSQGQQYTFKLVQKSGSPVLRLCHNKRRPKSESSSRLTKHRPQSESSSNHSYYVGSVSAPSLKRDKLYLQKSFVISSGLDKGRSEIILKNEWGRKWKLVFKHYKSNFVTLLTQGWRSFCQENRLKAGDSFKFRLAGTREKPVLHLCPTESKSDKTPLECPEGNDDIESLSLNSSRGDESSKSEESDEDNMKCLKIKKRKYCSNQRASSSYSQDRFMILTLTPSAFRTYKLYLPPGFTLRNGINKTKKITLLGQNGDKQVVNIYQEKTGRLRLGKGWREYCESQGIQINESFVLELIWGEETSPMLKFCNKVNFV